MSDVRKSKFKSPGPRTPAITLCAICGVIGPHIHVAPMDHEWVMPTEQQLALLSGMAQKIMEFNNPDPLKAL